MRKAILPDINNFQSKPYKTGRIDLSGKPPYLTPNNLIANQVESFRWLIETGLDEVVKEAGPIEEEITFSRLSKDGGSVRQKKQKFKLEFGKLEFLAPAVDDLKARLDKLNYESSLKVDVKLTIDDEVRRQAVYMGYYPWMTNRGTFIVNGNEKVIVSQLSRSPGIWFSVSSTLADGRQGWGAQIAPYWGAWLRISTLKDGSLSVNVDRSRRVSLSTFLMALDGQQTPTRVAKTLAEVNNGPFDFWQTTLEKDQNYRESPEEYQAAAISNIYSQLRPTDTANVKNATEVLHNRFFNPRQYNLAAPGRYKLNERLGLKTSQKHKTLQISDILATAKEIIRLNNQGGIPDDIDSLANRRIKTVGELVRNEFRNSFLRLERSIRERMKICEPATVTPSQLINSRPVAASVRTFFATSALSSFMDQVNCLSELSQIRRITAAGPGGLSSDRAGAQVRDIHQTHYGRVCPIETPEKKTIGLVLNLALYAKIDQYGFLQTPYRKVVQSCLAEELSGEIARVDLKNAKGQVVIKAGQKIKAKEAAELAKSGSKGEYYLVKSRVSNEVVYLNVDQEKSATILGLSVPVDEAGYFQKEYGPGRRDGSFSQFNVTDATHIDVSRQQIVAIGAGSIPFLEKNYGVRTLVATSQTRQAVPLVKPQSPTVGSGLEEVFARNSGHIVYAKAAGQVLSATAEKLSIKYDQQKSISHYKPMRYLRSNQGTVINQRVLVSVGQKIEAGQPLMEGASIKNGELALGCDLLGGYMFFDGLNFEDSIIISKRLVKEDILTSITIVEKTVEVRETKLGAETITRDIPNVSEHSLRNLDDTGVVRVGAEVKPGDILVGKITPKGEQDLSSEERLLLAIFGEKAKDVKDTSLRLDKGKAGKVIAVREFSRDKGDEMKSEVIQYIQVYIAESRKIQVGDKLANRYGNKGVIAKILPEEDMPYNEAGQHLDIILSPIGVPTRMNLGQLFESSLGQAASTLGVKVASRPFNPVPKEKISEMLEEAGLEPDGKQQLYDGRTGKPFIERTTVGPTYFYKLNHMVFDKVAARNIGPYTIVTQQPLTSKKHNGGQRFEEMVVWASAAYGAAHTIQEALTIKSDDLVGRKKSYIEIINQNEISRPKLPEGFNVLVKELQALGLKLELIDSQNQKALDAEDLIRDNRPESSDQGKKVDRTDVVSEQEAEKLMAQEATSDDEAVIASTASQGMSEVPQVPAESSSKPEQVEVRIEKREG